MHIPLIVINLQLKYFVVHMQLRSEKIEPQAQNPVQMKIIQLPKMHQILFLMINNTAMERNRLVIKRMY